MSYVKAGEASDYLLVPTNTVRNWLRSGRIASTKTPSGQYQIKIDDLLKFNQVAQVREKQVAKAVAARLAKEALDSKQEGQD